MQGWSGPPPARAQAFHVACSEGHRLQGQRTEGYQALRCPTCGEGIFVLPRSPLPDPPAPAGPERARIASSIEAIYEDDPIPLTDPIPSHPEPGVEQAGSQDESEAEIDWVDEAAEKAVTTPAPTKPPPAPKARPAAREVLAPASVPVPVPVTKAVAEFSIREWGWRHRNRLLAAGLVILVASAIGVRRWRQRLEGLPKVAEIGRTVGLKKLDEGDFHVAKKLLAEAAAALDSLGGDYQGGTSIRQGVAEAAIFTDLATEGLDQILENATTFREVKDWTAHFAAFYKGRSVILETIITAVPQAGKAGSSYQIGSYVFTGRGPKPVARATVDVSGLSLLARSEPKVGDPATFGARLESLELDSNTSTWIFKLEPDSGVTMTHEKALEKVFGPTDPGDEGSP